MHFYTQLISVLFPFVLVNNNNDLPPVNMEFVVDFTGAQVVTFAGDLLIAD